MSTPSYEDFERDYWAPDRDEVLNRMRSPQGEAPNNQTQGQQSNPWTTPGAPTNQPSNTGTIYQPDQTLGQLGEKNAAAPPPGGTQASSLAGAWNTLGTRGEGSGVPDTRQASGTASGTSPANGAWDRTNFRDAWMRSGVNTVEGMRAWLAANPTLAQGVTIVGPKQDKFQLPTGEIIDGILAAGLGGGQGGPQWTDAGGTQNGVPVNSGGGGGYSPPTGAGPGGAGAPGAGVPGGMQGQLYQILMDRAQQGLPDRYDPEVRAQADAYSANERRSQRNYMADLAESQGPTANLRGEQRMASERTGQRTGAFESELLGRRFAARREEIQNALNQWGAMLSEDQRLALQRELGYMNDAIQRRQLENQSQLGNRGLDLQWQNTLINNDQFNRDLGLRAEDRASYWDAVRTGLL